jgi:hypothetical protein
MVGIGGVTHTEKEADCKEGERGGQDRNSLIDLVLWGVKLLPARPGVKRRHENHEMLLRVLRWLRIAVRVEDNYRPRGR